MKYYIESIEQIYTDKEDEYNEYGKIEKTDSENLALSKYYKKLSDVVAAIGTTHTYIKLSVITSTGNVVKQEVLGVYIDAKSN